MEFSGIIQVPNTTYPIGTLTQPIGHSLSSISTFTSFTSLSSLSSFTSLSYISTFASISCIKIQENIQVPNITVPNITVPNITVPNITYYLESIEYLKPLVSIAYIESIKYIKSLKPLEYIEPIKPLAPLAFITLITLFSIALLIYALTIIDKDDTDDDTEDDTEEDTEEDTLMEDFRFSIIEECKILNKKGDIVSENKIFRGVLVDIWKTMEKQKILENTTFKFKNGNKRGVKGYNWCEGINMSFQNKDAIGTLREILHLVKLNDLTFNLTIRLKSDETVKFNRD
jgi:hypothetical protein